MVARIRSVARALVVLVGTLAFVAGTAHAQDGADAASESGTPIDSAGPPSAIGDDAPRLFDEPSPLQLHATQLFETGVAAWREGRHARAEELWRETLRVLGPPREPSSSDEVLFDRHAVLFDLGNAAFRGARYLEAIGWYRAALRYEPRHAGTRANLELATARAGLDPHASASDTLGVWRSYLAAWTPGEARWLALFGLAPLALALLVEAVRGGRAAALWALACFAAALLLVAPLLHLRATADDVPYLVVDPNGTALRSEARAAAATVGRIEAGATVQRVDALPEWVRVETDAGASGWVPADDVFELRR